MSIDVIFLPCRLSLSLRLCLPRLGARERKKERKREGSQKARGMGGGAS